MRALTIRDTALVGSLQTFTPLSLSPTVWLDASDTSTIVASGSPLRVSQWTDKSGNSYHLTQATSTLQPSSGTNSINSRNVIYFDGTRKLARLTANLYSGQNAGSVFVVASGTVSTVGNKSLFQVRTTANAARAQILALSSQVQAGGRRLDADAYQTVNASTIVDDSPFVAAGFFDWANARLWVGLNGVLTERSGGFQTAGSVTVSDDDISVGQNARDTATSYTGSIAEVLAFRRILSSTEQTNVFTYLKNKWGTP